MCNSHSNVSLGFAEKDVPVGTHMCLIYTDENERRESLLKYLLSGVESGERAACFSDKTKETDLRKYLEENGKSYDEAVEKQALSISGTSEVYFQDGVFDPDRMLNTLDSFYSDSRKMGFSASRVIGEMIPEVEKAPGGERLLEYESRVSILLRDRPVTSVCQYDANAFDGATILEVLKVHPKMIVKGKVVHNPFFIEPEEYLQGMG